MALGGRRHQSTCGAAAASKPVVAYKLNLHVFLLARPRSILGLCGVPEAAGVLSRSASLGILAKKKPKTFKFQKFLPDQDTNAHGSDTIYSINLSSISSFPDHSKIKSFIHDAKKNQTKQSFLCSNK